jgi:hypothetical protein
VFLDLDIMESSELQSGADLERGIEKGILGLEIVVDGEVLGDEGDLRLDDLSLAVVLEGELELGEGVVELAGDFVEENGAVAVELGGHSYGGPLREGECGFGGCGWWWRWRQRWRL